MRIQEKEFKFRIQRSWYWTNIANKSIRIVWGSIFQCFQIVPEPQGIADDLNELAAISARHTIDEEKNVRLNDGKCGLTDEVCIDDDEVERTKRLLRLTNK